MRAYDRCRLSVFITSSGQERLLWQAQLDERFLDGLAANLDEAVARVLAVYPPQSAAAAPAVPATAN